MISVGIAGCGKMSHSHMRVLMQMPDVKIAAVCDVDSANREQAAKSTGAVAFKNYRVMAENAPLDLVLIGLPPALHGDCACACAENGINVFIEKPMGIDSGDCQRIIDVCRENGVMLWVGHMQRYAYENQIAKALVDSGEYGKLISINETRSCLYPGPMSPGWLMDREVAGGGIMYNFGAHTLDMMKYLSDSEIDFSVSNLLFEEDDVEDAATGFLRLRSGVAGTFNLMGRAAVNRYDIVLYLTGGEIRIKPRKSVFVCKRDGVFKKIAGAGAPTLNSENQVWQYLQMRDVLAAVRGEGEVKVTGEYGKSIIEDIEGLYTSAGRHKFRRALV